MADPGPFERFYASALQHPWLLWAAALAALARVRTLPGLSPDLRRYTTALVGLSLADAWLTSSHVYGVGPLTGPLASAVPLFFVLAGDLRFLLLVLVGRPDGTLAWRGPAVLGAVGLTLVVPLGSQLVMSALPDRLDTSRVLFLVYEVAFAALTLALLAVAPQLRGNAWLRRVAGFVVVYYALWATADAVILGLHADWGFGLRVVPNVLYYGGLIAAMAVFAPRPAGGPR